MFKNQLMTKKSNYKNAIFMKKRKLIFFRYGDWGFELGDATFVRTTFFRKTLVRRAHKTT
jgi:hypothetical protein